MEALSMNFVVAPSMHKDDLERQRTGSTKGSSGALLQGDDASFYDDDESDDGASVDSGSGGSECDSDEDEDDHDEEEEEEEEDDDESYSCSSEGSMEEHQGTFMMGQQYFAGTSSGNNPNCFSDSFVTDGEASESAEDPLTMEDGNSNHTHASLQHKYCSSNNRS
ncbi:expressed unknown protein [Seminavis robusta]|uniref:Uncharacterized protein n=1 Tax=Seminavis robusta TaxID=568900 RepID=A0A9N8HS00_9STRA|nr:expressed unknown protein [Seminavis robusta]|eukprot:Sro1458_g274460.1 n/a (165) ;mRNA; r:23105-23599